MKKYKITVVKTPTNSQGWKDIAKIYPWTVMKKEIGKEARISLGSYTTKEKATKAKAKEISMFS